MDLDLLRTFLAVYRAGSFTRAAPGLGISQPAITAQIRTLEERLATTLFIRNPRGVVPTGPADRLARLLAPHLDALATLVQDNLSDDPFTRTVHLAGPADLTTARALPSLAGLVGRGLRLRVALGLPDELLPGLVAGEHDIVLSTIRPRLRGVSITPLMDEEFVLVGAPVWRKRLPAGLLLEEASVIDETPLVAYAENLPIIRRYWLTVFERPPPTQATVVVPDLRGVATAVASGMGISVLPRYLIAEALESGALVMLHQPEIPPINTLYVAIRSGTGNAPHIELVRSHLLVNAQSW